MYTQWKQYKQVQTAPITEMIVLGIKFTYDSESGPSLQDGDFMHGHGVLGVVRNQRVASLMERRVHVCVTIRYVRLLLDT